MKYALVVISCSANWEVHNNSGSHEIKIDSEEFFK